MIRVMNNKVKLIDFFNFNCKTNNLKSFDISKLFNHMKMNDSNLKKKITNQSAQTQIINNSNFVFISTMLINWHMLTMNLPW